jgi:hypothetical protein
MLAAATAVVLVVIAVGISVSPASADVGTAGFYLPPYVPTACHGSDVSQFPSNNLFVAVGDGVWDNGAACGRHYYVRCLSGSNQPCSDPNLIISVVVVDHCRDGCLTGGGTMTIKLSQTAYDMLVRPGSTDWVNVEFAQV